MDNKYKSELISVIEAVGINDDIDVFIDYLLDHSRPIAEGVCKLSLDNLYINRIDYTYTKYTNQDYIPSFMRIYWSGDNHPKCNIIYANSYSYDISDLLVNYREWKLNMLLSK